MNSTRCTSSNKDLDINICGAVSTGGLKYSSVRMCNKTAMGRERSIREGGCKARTLQVNRSSAKMVFVCVVLLCVIPFSGVHGFNLDSVKAETLSGPVGSYFGYSVASLKRNNGESW